MAQTPQRRLTSEALKAHLREAVEMIARLANPQEYRNHLFALLVLKRVFDLYEERRLLIEQEALAAGYSPEAAHARAHDPDEHRWLVPPSASWPSVMSLTENFGVALERACAELERRNKSLLTAVLTPLRFEGAGSAEENVAHETMLHNVLEHFDKLRLGENDLDSPSALGEAAQFLIEPLAAWGAKKNASHASASALMQLLAELLRPEPGMRVCDPACGAGGALVACANYVRQQGHSPQTLSLYGQEYDAETWSLCKMNLLLHDLHDARLALGSTLTQPWLDENGALLQFDLVISEPPFSLMEWEHEAAARFSLGRFEAGLPPPRRGEFAFVQHIAATLNARGRAAIVVPHGVLFRGGIEKQIRAALLQKDLIEAVITLPEGVLLGLKSPAAVLILNRNKPAERREHVMFIDAALVASSARTFQLDETTRRKLVALYHASGRQEHDAMHVATLMTLHAIATEHDYNLSVGRYVNGNADSHEREIEPLLAEIAALERKQAAAQLEFERMLHEFGYK